MLKRREDIEIAGRAARLAKWCEEATLAAREAAKFLKDDYLRLAEEISAGLQRVLHAMKEHQVEELYLLHVRNAVWSSRRGFLGDGADIVRGPLNQWSVTRDGVTLKQLADFDDGRPPAEVADDALAAEAVQTGAAAMPSTAVNHPDLLQNLLHSTRRRLDALCGKSPPR